MKNTNRLPSWFSKTATQSVRRRTELQAHNGDLKAAMQALKQLSKNTNDNESSQKAEQDAKYFSARIKANTYKNFLMG